MEVLAFLGSQHWPSSFRLCCIIYFNHCFIPILTSHKSSTESSSGQNRRESGSQAQKRFLPVPLEVPPLETSSPADLGISLSTSTCGTTYPVTAEHRCSRQPTTTKQQHWLKWLTAPPFLSSSYGDIETTNIHWQVSSHHPVLFVSGRQPFTPFWANQGEQWTHDTWWLTLFQAPFLTMSSYAITMRYMFLPCTVGCQASKVPITLWMGNWAIANEGLSALSVAGWMKFSIIALLHSKQPCRTG